MINLILVAVLVISLYTDLKERKILNVITLPAIMIGLIIHSIVNGLDGFTFSGLGFLLGSGLLLIPFLMGGMGAGDVKLLAAIGALKGPTFVFHAFLFTSIIGGIIALVLLLKYKQLLNSIKRILFAAKLKTLDMLDKQELHHAFPYGVAITTGTFLVLVRQVFFL